MKEISISEVHKHLLDIAIVFDKICNDNNIEYWMLGGTMLGAVRHKGFIPWDDDMDFGVKRADYERLKNILRESLPLEYRILTNMDSDTIIADVIKIEDVRTKVTEIGLESVESSKGVNIDIFPLDYTNSDFGKFSRNRWIHLLSRLQSYRYTPVVPKQIKQRIFWIISFCFFPFVSKKMSTQWINRLLVRTTGTHLANHYGAWGLKEIVPVSAFEPSCKYQFEEILLSGVKDSHLYLSTLYKDYMTLPPENKRHIHLGTFYEI